MVRITLMDGSTKELSRDGILGVAPCSHLFRHAHLKSDALIYQNGRLLPVLGPLPEGARAWILLFETHGQVIRDLPSFDDDAGTGSVTAISRSIATANAQEERHAESDEEILRKAA